MNNSSAITPHFSDRSQVEQYSNNSTMQRDAAMKIFELFQFKGNERVLDLGCGVGNISLHICQHLTKNQVHGMDISKEMIAKASQIADSRLTFSVGDMTVFSTEEKYDVVYSGYALQYGDAEKTLARIFDSLKTGGAVLITMPGKFEGSLAVNADKLAQSEKWKEEFKEFKNTRKYYDTLEFTELLQKVGLIPKHVQSIVQKMEFPDQEAIKAFYLPVSLHARHLPEHRRSEFISDLVLKVLSQNEALEIEKPFIYQNKLETIAFKPV